MKIQKKVIFIVLLLNFLFVANPGNFYNLIIYEDAVELSIDNDKNRNNYQI